MNVCKIICVLVLSGGLICPLFAGTERGNRLIAEAAGSQGIAGTAGPNGAPGVAGAAGVQGVQGLTGIPSAPGILGYSDFYALMPTDNPGAVGIGVAVEFPRNGSSTGASVRTGPSTFNIPAIGTYLIQFQVSVTEAAKLQLRLNGALLPQAVFGRDGLTDQIVGILLLTTSTINSVLEVVNVSSAVRIITPFAGSLTLTHPVSAHLSIIRLQ